MELERSQYQANMDQSRSDLKFQIFFSVLAALIWALCLWSAVNDYKLSCLVAASGLAVCYVGIRRNLLRSSCWPGRYKRIGINVMISLLAYMALSVFITIVWL